MLMKLLYSESTPIDLPETGERVTFQGKTKIGGYPLTIIENPEHTAYCRYEKEVRGRLLKQNLQVTL